MAPRFTGNLAFRAFCTPPRTDLDGAQRKLVAQAEAQLEAAERLRLPFEGGKVQAYRIATPVAPSRGTVLLLHGWTGRAAFMSAFIEPLLQSGFDIVALDLPAHGRSSGRILHVPLAVAALHALHQRFGPWHGIVAHSFGGPIAAAFVSGAIPRFEPVPVERMVLIAAPSSLPDIFAWFGEAIGLTERGRRALDANVLRIAGRELAEFEGDAMLREAGVPTLLLHAPDDPEVGYRNAERLAAAGPHVALQPLHGLGHRRILYAPQTVEAARAFMAAG
jgi:pimeloyl-ACP methyl ester carboxylesterase